MRWVEMTGLLLVALLSGCYPGVMHGPAVQPGLSGGPAGVVGSNVGDLSDFTYTLAGVVNYGWRVDHESVSGIQLGAQVPLDPRLFDSVGGPVEMLQEFTRWDAYLQFRRADSTAIGVGLLTALPTFEQFMPYVQFGSVDRDGGWYTTQGLLISRRESIGNSDLAWVPGIAFLATSDALDVHFQANSAVFLSGNEGVSLALGLIFDFHQ